MLTQIITALILYALYLLLHADEDAKLRLQKAVLHPQNWRQRALVGIIISYLIFGFNLTALSFCILLIPYAWILFDPMMNYFMGFRGAEIWTHMGLSKTDDFFRRFNVPLRAITITKGAFLILALISFLIILKRGL